MKIRSRHRSVAIGDSMMHIGGLGSLVGNFSLGTYEAPVVPLERWTLNGTGFNKEELEATLTNYNAYPESFIVSSDFCV